MKVKHVFFFFAALFATQAVIDYSLITETSRIVKVQKLDKTISEAWHSYSNAPEKTILHCDFFKTATHIDTHVKADSNSMVIVTPTEVRTPNFQAKYTSISMHNEVFDAKVSQVGTPSVKVSVNPMAYDFSVSISDGSFIEHHTNCAPEAVRLAKEEKKRILAKM